MFANVLIAPVIVQEDQKLPNYKITTGNTFKLPMEGSFFSFSGLIILGDFDKRNEEDFFEIEFFKEENPEKKLIKTGKNGFPGIDGAPESATLQVNFTNVVIPSFGKYVFSFLLNGQEIAKSYLSFRAKEVEENG